MAAKSDANKAEEVVEELTYPLGAVSKLTGVTADTLRAWERRYQVVVPLRTAGGTRRYRASDLERLRLVKAAVESGHRIGDVAKLDDEQLTRAAAQHTEPVSTDATDAIMVALAALDGDETERLISLQLSALGPARFATRIAAPLLERIGEAWVNGELSVAAEHLATSVLRSLLGASLRSAGRSSATGPIVFGTLPGERHEMGLLIAAITASAAGGQIIYLGPDLPTEALTEAVAQKDAGVVVLSLVAQDTDDIRSNLARLRAELPARVEVWVGGSRAWVGQDVPNVTMIESFDQLEQQVRVLGIQGARQGV